MKPDVTPRVGDEGAIALTATAELESRTDREAGRVAALDAARAARRVVGAYLAVTWPALLAGLPWRGDGAASLALALAHLAALLWLLAGPAPRTAAARFLDAWAPLLAIPALYAELPLLITGFGQPFRDSVVLGWERALFGEPARTFAGVLPWRPLSETLHAGYLSYYFLIYAPPLILYLRHRRRAFGETVLAVSIAYTACFVVFVAFPVQGPRYLWPIPPGLPEGPVEGFARWLLANGSSRGAAFPSSHAAVAVTEALMALRFQRPVGLVASLSALLILVGAVYGGFHYATDMLAGTVLACIVVAAVSRLYAVTAGSPCSRKKS